MLLSWRSLVTIATHFLYVFYKLTRIFTCRNDSADRMQDLQSLVDGWSKTKDLKNPVTLKIYGSKITGKENILVDGQRCKSSKKPTKKAKSISVPIPDTCPAS